MLFRCYFYITDAIVVEGDGRPAWMKTLHQTATSWLKLLPQELPVSAICNLVSCPYSPLYIRDKKFNYSNKNTLNTFV